MKVIVDLSNKESKNKDLFYLYRNGNLVGASMANNNYVEFNVDAVKGDVFSIKLRCEDAATQDYTKLVLHLTAMYEAYHPKKFSEMLLLRLYYADALYSEFLCEDTEDTVQYYVDIPSKETPFYVLRRIDGSASDKYYAAIPTLKNKYIEYIGEMLRVSISLAFIVVIFILDSITIQGSHGGYANLLVIIGFILSLIMVIRGSIESLLQIIKLDDILDSIGYTRNYNCKGDVFLDNRIFCRTQNIIIGEEKMLILSNNKDSDFRRMFIKNVHGETIKIRLKEDEFKCIPLKELDPVIIITAMNTAALRGIKRPQMDVLGMSLVPLFCFLPFNLVKRFCYPYTEPVDEATIEIKNTMNSEHIFIDATSFEESHRRLFSRDMRRIFLYVISVILSVAIWMIIPTLSLIFEGSYYNGKPILFIIILYIQIVYLCRITIESAIYTMRLRKKK